MKRHNFFFVTIIFILASIFFTSISMKACELEKTLSIADNKSEYSILVDLNELTLYLISENKNEIVKTYPIAGGKPSTPSPIGTWQIVGKAVNWGAGFGSRWMALNVPWGKYGIHGTNKPLTVGGPNSLGCIRMLNKDVEDLYNRVDCGTIVVIYGGPYGLAINNFRNLIPGNRGADVYEVQQRMKNRGYYLENLDGIYGDSMKNQVIKFKKDFNLSVTHTIDKEFYNELGINRFE